MRLDTVRFADEKIRSRMKTSVRFQLMGDGKMGKYRLAAKYKAGLGSPLTMNRTLLLPLL